MTRRYPYWHWVLGAFVAWVAILLLTWRLLTTSQFHYVIVFCGGFWLGVLEASLARRVSQ